MGMEHWMNVVNPPSGLGRHMDGRMEETKELQKQTTETTMETYQSTENRDGAIRCPIPRKSTRPYMEYDLKSAQDLSDLIVSKISFSTALFWAASPPYFMGSPPVRASNPIVHDTQFRAWKVQTIDQSLGVPIPTKGYSVGYRAKEGSPYKP